MLYWEISCYLVLCRFVETIDKSFRIGGPYSNITSTDYLLCIFGKDSLFEFFIVYLSDEDNNTVRLNHITENSM